MIRRTIHMLAGILVALMMSQFPAFHQQYLQRLGGHLDELNFQVAALDERAAGLGMSRFDYIRSLKNNPEEPAQTEGRALEDLVTRQVRFEQSKERLSTISMLYIGPAMLVEMEWEVAKATAKEFSPGVSLTLAGLGFIVFGFFLGYLGMMGFLSLLLFPKRPAPQSDARPDIV